MMNPNQSNHEQIYSLVRAIPKGRVATYGQIACLLGYPRHARQVGYALAALNDQAHVPWHRVVNAQGMISLRRLAGYETLQRLLLEDEGIEFDENNRISLKKFQWRPNDPGAST